MVFKKPYAFLIKNFRLIHIILSGIILFIIFKYRNVSGFFSEYAKGGIKSSVGLSNTYIGSFLYLAVIAAIVFAFLMLLLMHNKKKPYLFYVLLLSFYVIMLFALLYAGSVLYSLEEASITVSLARTYSGIYFVLSLPQFYFLVMGLVRASGFDVKKFNFNKDLAELEIDSKDNEEFEFVLGNNTYIYERKIRRTIREVKYYVLENKFIISIVAGIAGGILLIYLFLNANFINKIYRMGQNGNLNNFNYKLKSAYVTEYDYNGKLISKGKKYVVVGMSVKNISSRALPIDRLAVYLSYGNQSAYPMPSLRGSFVDLGQSYINETLSPNNSRDVLFIFEISSKTNYKKFMLKVLKDITTDEDNQAVYNYANFKVKPIKMDKKPVRVERKVNELMYLGETVFQDSNIIITKTEILSKYEYQYESCKNDQCKTYFDVIAPADPINEQLLVVSYKLKMNPNLGIKETMKNDKYFFDKFLKTEYTYSGKTVTKNLTTNTYPALKNKIFAVVPTASTTSDTFNVLINTRDYRYYLNTK